MYLENTFRMYLRSLIVSAIAHLISRLDNIKLCIGNPDEKFMPIKEANKGVLKSKDGDYIKSDFFLSVTCPMSPEAKFLLLL